MSKKADKYFGLDAWKVIEKGFNPEYSRISESIFALSNEHMGIRGYFDEGGGTDSLRGAYINGVYEMDLNLPKSYKGIVDKTHFMVNNADWVYTEIWLEGEKLDLASVNFSDFTRVLDMKKGTLERTFVWHTQNNKGLRLKFIRFLDMGDIERGYQRVEFEPINFSGQIKVITGINFEVIHESYNKMFWQEEKKFVSSEYAAIISKTKTSGQYVFSGFTLDTDGSKSPIMKDLFCGYEVTLDLGLGNVKRLDKYCINKYDENIGSRLWEAGLEALGAQALVAFDEALKAQAVFWGGFWNKADIIIDGDEENQQGIRFCLFNLTQAYLGRKPTHNIGAKGLTGEFYNGHAFWETEAYCLQYYVLTYPKAAKSLLEFRYTTLPQAKNRAKMMDCEGACYPVATLNGDEGCPLWQHANLQFQASTAVAYGIWHYSHMTDDLAFLYGHGMEMLIEISRYLVSRVGKNPITGQFGYYGVMGPDEFHLMVNNNAYTNYMSMRSLQFTLDTLNQLKKSQPSVFENLAARLSLTGVECSYWGEVASN
ncbi:MAG: family 65 glycosyl hydrolase, partial [Clostridiales bacterium]|nr:family 65 glycosyl hydrolase [Clostridiales bacterium]